MLKNERRRVSYGDRNSRLSKIKPLKINAMIKKVRPYSLRVGAYELGIAEVVNAASGIKLSTCAWRRRGRLKRKTLCRLQKK